MTPDLLSEDENIFPEYTYATAWQRFFNFVIDNVVMKYTISYVTSYGIVFLFRILFPDFMLRIISDDNKVNLYMLGYVIAIFNYIIYYTLLEKLMNGQSVGKLITKTKALRTDGNELTFKDALLRSLCRLVPFEAFSGFGFMWHDTWTHTMVIKK